MVARSEATLKELGRIKALRSIEMVDDKVGLASWLSGLLVIVFCMIGTVDSQRSHFRVEANPAAS